MSENDLPQGTRAINTQENDKHKGSFTERLKSLVDYPEPGSGQESKYKSEGLFQRQTHSKTGEHIFIVFNDRHLSKSDLPGQCFIQVYGPDHQNSVPQIQEEYKWTIFDDPALLYPNSVQRIEELMAMFEPAAEDDNGQA
jgi:hypothetical protein